jgi:hypothetical protein
MRPNGLGIVDAIFNSLLISGGKSTGTSIVVVVELAGPLVVDSFFLFDGVAFGCVRDGSFGGALC